MLSSSTKSFPTVTVIVLIVLCSSSILLYVHRDHKDDWGRGAQDGHLDFHAAPEFWQYSAIVSPF